MYVYDVRGTWKVLFWMSSYNAYIAYIHSIHTDRQTATCLAINIGIPLLPVDWLSSWCSICLWWKAVGGNLIQDIQRPKGRCHTGLSELGGYEDISNRGDTKGWNRSQSWRNSCSSCTLSEGKQLGLRISFIVVFMLAPRGIVVVGCHWQAFMHCISCCCALYRSTYTTTAVLIYNVFCLLNPRCSRFYLFLNVLLSVGDLLDVRCSIFSTNKKCECDAVSCVWCI